MAVGRNGGKGGEVEMWRGQRGEERGVEEEEMVVISGGRRDVVGAEEEDEKAEWSRGGRDQ